MQRFRATFLLLGGYIVLGSLLVGFGEILLEMNWFLLGITVLEFLLAFAIYCIAKSCVAKSIAMVITIGCMLFILLVAFTIDLIKLKKGSRKMAEDFSFLTDYGYLLGRVGNYKVVYKHHKNMLKHVEISLTSQDDKLVILAFNGKNPYRPASLLDDVKINSNNYNSQVSYAQKALKEWLDNNK